MCASAPTRVHAAERPAPSFTLDLPLATVTIRAPQRAVPAVDAVTHAPHEARPVAEGPGVPQRAGRYGSRRTDPAAGGGGRRDRHGDRAARGAALIAGTR